MRIYDIKDINIFIYEYYIFFYLTFDVWNTYLIFFFWFSLDAQWDSVIWKRRIQGGSLVRDPFWNSWLKYRFFYLFCVIWRASSTSVTSSAIVAEMRLTRLKNSVLEEIWVCWDLSGRTAADAISFADDPSRDLRYWWLYIKISCLTLAKPPLRRVAGIGRRTCTGL